MVWGIATNGKSFGKVLVDTDQVTLDLPNGDWKFFAMAWQNASSIKLSGAMGAIRCAESLPVKLAGQPVAPALVLSVANCNTPMFKGNLSGGMTTLQTRLRLCESVENFVNNTDACTNDRSDINRKADKAPVMSVRISLAEYGNGVNIPISDGLGRCIAMNDNPNGQWSVPGPGTLVIPTGDPANPALSPFRLELELFFETTTCSDPTPSKIVLNNGVVTNISSKKHFVSGVSDVILAVAVPDSMVCGHNRVASNPFAGGSGGENFPYLICGARQLQNALTPAFGNSSFRLAADVDLNTVSKGFTDDANLPVAAECWTVGQNWHGLGRSFAAAPGCAPTVNPYTGNFDGNNHLLKNLRLRLESAYSVGFISSWSPVAEGYIRDLHFENVEISAAGETGTVVGYKSNANNSVISNISVKGGMVESRMNPADSGGVLGQGNNVDLIDIIASDLTVIAGGSTAGGIFGILSDSRQLKNIHSRTIVLPRDQSNAAGGLGGIGGSFNSSALLTDGLRSLSHEGIIIGTGQSVGGLFGSLGAINQPLTHAYANSAIAAAKTMGDNRVGGLFGTLATGLTFDRIFFMGHIIDKCDTSCNRGRFVGYLDGTATVTNSYHGAIDGFINNLLGDNSDFSTNPIQLTEAQLLDATHIPAITNAAPFIHRSGDIPRLVSERHICAADPVNGISARDAIATQATLRGSASNPIVICNKSQLQALSSLTGTKTAILGGGIHLRSTYSTAGVSAGTTLDGGQGFLFGMVKTNTPGNNEVRAPIQLNNGIIRNLNLANIVLEMTTPDGINGMSGAVGINSGIMENVQVLGASLVSADGTNSIISSGLAHRNNGTIRRSGFNGNILSRSSVAGLVNENYGTITDSSSGASVYFNGMSMNNLGGVSLTNYSGAVIERVRVESQVYSNSFGANNTSFGVVHNYGTIRDFEVSGKTNWQFTFNGNNLATIAAYNYAGSVIQRAVVEGMLFNNDTSSSVTASNTTARPVANVTVQPTGVITLVPGGRVLSNIYHTSTDVTCSEPTTARIEFNTSYLPATGPFTDSGAYWASFNPSTHILWLLIERQGARRLARVTAVPAYTMGAFAADVDVATCAELDITVGTSVRLVQDYSNILANAQGNVMSSPFNGVVYPQELDSASLVGPWINNYYDPSVPADLTAMLSYYSTIFSGGTASSRAWELDATYGLDLFNKN